MNLRLVTILVGAFALAGAIAVLVFWMLGRGEDAGERGAARFATALVKNDPALAPAGGARYVEGVRAQFGDVRAARVIDVRMKRFSSRTRTTRRTWTRLIADVHVDTQKGPAVLELHFRGGSLLGGDAKIKAVNEVLPRDVSDDALSDAEFVALAKAFQRRDRPANNLDLSGQLVRVPDIVKDLPQRVRRITPPAPTPSAQLRDAQRRLRCVKKAKGDVEKLAACAR